MLEKQIFLSYASDDRVRARFVVQSLEERGWSVWWDTRDIPPGDRFSRVIDDAISRSNVIVVLWSRRSVDSDWVLDEASDGKKRGILVPVLIDDVEIPRGFRQLQHARLVDWYGAEDHPELEKLFDAVQRLAPPVGRDFANTQRDASSAQRGVPEVAAKRRSPGSAVEPPAVNRPINLGFDGPIVNGFPDGWFNGLGYVAGVSVSYVWRVVRRPEVNGNCLWLQKSSAHQAEFGSVMQRCLARLLGGRTVRFQGELRSEGVLRWAGLWLRADGPQHESLYFDNMHRRPIRGTTEWDVYSIDAQLSPLTQWLNYGVVISGEGQLWVDNCRLLVWDEAGAWHDW